MKKQMNVKSFAAVFVFIMILACIGILSSCLDSVNFDPNDFEVKVDITGEISTTDITSAVLMITNRSKTVDVVNVVITQPEWLPTEENPDALQPSISFRNKPKRLERKAQYLAPSDKSYQVDFIYNFDAYGTTQAGTGYKTIIVPLPIPKEIVEIFIYRDKDGKVIIDTVFDENDSDPEDTGNPPIDPSLGEGSVPAEIPPENRNRMGTFVVINRTSSQIIDSVNFVKGDADYTMHNIGVKDRQSIALGQGGWTTSVKYTRTGEKTLGPVNSIIVPSNDPQTTKEHYLHFYLNKRGEYAISQEWPPFPNDVDEEDILPPDVGYGRGVIKIINESYAVANKVIITNMQNSNYGSLDIGFRNFTPSIPVQYNKTGYVNVTGSSSFPIDNHANYLIMVNLHLNDNSDATVMRKAYLKDQVVTIVITQNDITTPPTTNPEKGNNWVQTPNNIWWLYDKDDNLIIGPLWGGYDGQPGGGDDKYVTEFVTNGAKSYWVSLGQNIWQEVKASRPRELGEMTGGGWELNPAQTPGLPVFGMVGGKFYLGPYTDETIPYYYGDKALIGGNGKVESEAGKMHFTDDKYYLNGGGMTTTPPTPPTPGGGVDITKLPELPNGKVIEIDGIEWIKVRNYLENEKMVLLMLKDAAFGSSRYDSDSNFKWEYNRAEIEPMVDTWYGTLNSPTLKKYAWQVSIGNSPTETWPSANNISHGFYAFIPRKADISRLTAQQRACNKMFWTSTRNPIGGFVGGVQDVGNADGTFHYKAVVNNYEVWARPAIWLNCGIDD